MPNTLPLHNSQMLNTKFTTQTPKFDCKAPSCRHARTPRALKAIFGQEVFMEPGGHAVKTPESRHEPGETHNGFGVKAQNIVNYYDHELDTIYTNSGMTLHKP